MKEEREGVDRQQEWREEEGGRSSDSTDFNKIMNSL